ncbi:MAG: class I SAM-dependent methyltransferase [Oligoflexia bacterium]|nr:class I SAM-dependent methyltransferase [Oligoflexia bacterium]
MKNNKTLQNLHGNLHENLQIHVKEHYQKHPYPQYPIFSSIQPHHSFALNVRSIWSHFNNLKLKSEENINILLAGCGSFSPYPTSVANSKANIWALDLSKKNLDRARLHCMLHRKFNIKYIEGDLLEFDNFPLFFHFIDCYGVIHHIKEDKKALKNICNLLSEGGIARIMVYSTGARKKIESARRAFRVLKIDNLKNVKKIITKTKDKSKSKSKAQTKDSQFLALLKNNFEANFDSGIADMFLHPYVKTYSIDQLNDLLKECDLTPLKFIHHQALADTSKEIDRLRILEKNDNLFNNFILYVGRTSDQKKRMAAKTAEAEAEAAAYITLNPVIKKYLNLWSPFLTDLSNKFGKSMQLNYQHKSLLRYFRKNRRMAEVYRKFSKEKINQISSFLDALLLIKQ